MSTKFFVVIFDGREVTPEQVAAAALKRIREGTEEAWRKANQTEPPQELPAIDGGWGLWFGPRHPSGFQTVRAISLENTAGNLTLEDDVLARELSRVLPTPFLYLGYTSSTDNGLTAIAFERGEVTWEKRGSERASLKPFFGPHFGLTRSVLRIVEDWLVADEAHNPFGPNSWERIISENKRRTDGMARIFLLGTELFTANPSLTEAELTGECEARFGKATHSEWLSFAYRFLRSAYKTSLPQENPSRMFVLTRGTMFAQGEGMLLAEPKEITPKEYFAIQEHAREELEARKTEKFGPPVDLELTAEEKTRLSYDEQKRELYRRWRLAVQRYDVAEYSHSIATYGFKVETPVERGDYVQWEDGFARVGRVTLRPDKEHETFVEEAHVIMRNHDAAGNPTESYRSFNLVPATALVPIPEADVPETWRTPETWLY